MEMEVDDVGESVPKQMEEFLLHKLNEIKNASKWLKIDNDKKQEMIAKCSERLRTSELQNKVQVNYTWRRIYCGRVIFGFELRNSDGKSILHDVSAVVHWNSKQPLQYGTKLMTKRLETSSSSLSKHAEEFQHPNKIVQELLAMAKASPNIQSTKSLPTKDEWIETSRLSDPYAVTILLIKLDMPAFGKQKSYDFDAVVTYRIGNETGQSLLEPFSLSAADLQSRHLTLRSTEIMLGNDDAFLTATFVSDRTELDVYVEEDSQRNFDNCLHINCMLDEMPVTSSSKWFYANNLGSVLSGAMIQLEPYEVATIQRINVYTRDDNQLFAMLHHLHSHIDGIRIQNHRPENAIFNRKVSENSVAGLDIPVLSQVFFSVPTSDSTTQQDANLLAECLEEQIALAEKVCTESGKRGNGDAIDYTRNAKDYVKFRCDLADLEQNTDFLLAAIAKRWGENG